MQLAWFILLVGVLITVHELGHYVAARAFGVKVVRLSLGFGPRLASVRRGGTEYALSLVPLGGYVRLLGEDPADAVPSAERGHALPSKSMWQRVVIVVAGPLANLLLPVGLYFAFFAMQQTALSATIGTVLAGEPADGVLLPGDLVVAIDDAPVRYWDELNAAMLSSPGEDLRITVEREGRTLPRIVTPRAHRRRDALGDLRTVGLIGVAPYFSLAQVGLATVDDGAGGSPAARAGLRTFDVITSVQGHAIAGWSDLERVLAQSHGEAMVLTYLRRQASPPGWAPVARLEPGATQLLPVRVAGERGPRWDTGLRPAELYLDAVEPGSPAARAGLRPGDVLTALDGQPLHHFELLAQAFAERTDRRFLVGWRTAAGESRSAEVEIESRTERDEYDSEATAVVFGASPCRAVRPVPSVEIEARAAWAAARAVEATASVGSTTARVLARLVLGRLPARSVGGPLFIYHVAGVAAARGSGEYLAMMALLSLNLGLLNLLPVPLLDGGQLLFLGVEAARRRPLGARSRARATLVGVAILGALLLLALRNDVLRLWAP